MNEFLALLSKIDLPDFDSDQIFAELISSQSVLCTVHMGKEEVLTYKKGF